jgi:hypothetical protein
MSDNGDPSSYLGSPLWGLEPPGRLRAFVRPLGEPERLVGPPPSTSTPAGPFGVAGSGRVVKPRGQKGAPIRLSTPDSCQLRGEGSIPVPLPPPAWPEPSILCTRLLAISPVLGAISDLSSGPQIDGIGYSSANGSFLSGALDSANSIRFSKFEPFEMFMNSKKWGFCSSSRTGKSIRFRNRHIRAKSAKVSGEYLKYSRFAETRAGDGARSALRGVGRSSSPTFFKEAEAGTK